VEEILVLVLIGGMVGLILLGIVVGFIVVAPKGKVGETELLPDTPFEIRCTPKSDAIHKVFMRYGVRFERVGRRSRAFGVIVDIRVESGGVVFLDEPLGLGWQAPEGIREIGSWELMVSSGGGLSHSYRKATVELCSLSGRPPGAEVVITGTVSTVEGTVPQLFKMFVAR
jgi:hypothetical protein